MAKDWDAWHRHYDDDGSALAGRLRVVQRDLARALTEAPRDPDGTVRLVAMCAGEGRDVLPVLAAHDGPVGAVLVELDPDLAAKARAAAPDGVSVRVGDAGDPGTYAGLPPAHIVMACGVFGNTTVADAHRTIEALPGLLADDGLVIWTRGHFGSDGPDPAEDLREHFAASGFAELSFTKPDDAHFRVGLNRLVRRPARVGAGRMFSFV